MNVNTNFRCRIYDIKGNCLKIDIPELNPAYYDILNTLCGAYPVKWFDKSSHNKIIRCDKELIVKMMEIASKYKYPAINEFFRYQIEGCYITFLREGVLLLDEDTEQKAVYLAASMTFDDNYDIISYGKDKIFTGPENLRSCVCRFCNRTNQTTRFKKENAHAVPHALGNRLLFCNDECVECNSILSGIDKELTEYLKLRRSEYKICNKKNKIIQVYGHNFFYDGPTGDLKISQRAILEEKDDEYYVKLEGADPISHYGIYKSLSKAAIDLIPRELVNDYSTTVKWIKGEIVPTVLPNVYYVYHSTSVSQPEVNIFVKKSSSIIPEYPKCIVAMRLMDLTFIYLIPLSDDGIVYPAEYLRGYLNFIIPNILKPEDMNGVFVECLDMEDKVGKFSHVKEWVKKSECTIVNQSEFSHTQEKSPNNIEFPPFNTQNVILIDNQVSIDYLEADKNIKLETAYTRIIKHHFTFDNQTSSLSGIWQIEMASMYQSKLLLKATGVIKASYSPFSDVVSVEYGELSPFFVEYMLDYVCKHIGNSVAEYFPSYDFSRMAIVLMEAEGNILHPKNDVEQSVMMSK